MKDGEDFTVTRFGIPDRYPFKSLNDVMELDHVIRVLPGRMVTEPAYAYAPEVAVELDADGQMLPDAEQRMVIGVREHAGWEILRGWSGQVGGSRTWIMHPSEFIGGNLADYVLDTPGLWAAVEVSGLYPSQEAEDNDGDAPIGWVLAYRETD